VTQASPTRSRRQTLLADGALLTVAIGWGFNFIVIKYAVDTMAPMLYLMLRHVVAVLLLVLIMPRSITQSRPRDWLFGAVLGSFLFIAFTLQTIGLQYTTPAKSGFITGLNVAMVPFLFMLVARRSPGLVQVAGALVAAVGLGVLSLRGNFTLSWGDGLTLISALAYAGQITATGFFAPKTRPATLAITQIVVAAALFSVVTPFFAPVSVHLPGKMWAAIVWTAAMGTVYAFLVQATAQRRTTSTHTAVILCLESVFAAFFSVLFGYESLTGRLFGGAALIFAGILVIEALPADSGGRLLARLGLRRPAPATAGAPPAAGRAVLPPLDEVPRLKE
jgi:drug/metabolite transporter (DMT)-like permease